MHRTARLASILVGVLLGSAGPALSGEFAVEEQGGIHGRYLVMLDERVQAANELPMHRAAVDDVARELARFHGGSVLMTWDHALRGFAIEMPERAARALSRDFRVRRVEPDRMIELSAATPQCSRNGSVLLQPSAMPTSPQPISCAPANLSWCTDNWGLDRIDQRATPLDLSYSFTATGRGVHLYFLDTGIDATHEEFRDGTGASRIGNGQNTWPWLPPSHTADYNGHGTHVAAIAAGRRYGVAKGATIHPVRVSGGDQPDEADADFVSISNVIGGINWIAGNAIRPAAVNMSLNWEVALTYEDGAENVMEMALLNLIRVHGIAVFNSAGNSNKPVSQFSPSRVPELFVVGGTHFSGEGWEMRWALAPPGQPCRPGDERTMFSQCGSNFGDVDVFAPAAGILSAWPRWSPSRAACLLTGTSMAAPLALGVAALYLETNPTATPAQIEAHLKGRATAGALNNYWLGWSPNLLLFSR